MEGAWFVVENPARDLRCLEREGDFLIEGVVATGRTWGVVVIVMVGCEVGWLPCGRWAW